MVKVNKLKARIVELEMTVDAVAERMGVDKSTLYRRFQAPDSLTVGEVGKLSEILELDDRTAMSIFFSV